MPVPATRNLKCYASRGKNAIYTNKRGMEETIPTAKRTELKLFIFSKNHGPFNLQTMLMSSLGMIEK